MDLAKIKALFEQGKYDQVLIEYEDLEDSDRLAGSVYKMMSFLFKDPANHNDEALGLGKGIIAKAHEKNLILVEIHAQLAVCEILRINFNTNFLSDPQTAEIFREQWLQSIKQAEDLLQKVSRSSIDPPAELQAELFHQQGLYYLRKLEFEKAQAYLEKGKEISEKIQFILGLANANQVLGWVKQSTNDLSAALDYFHQALAQFEKIPNEPEITNICLNLASINASLGKYDLAVEYQTRAIEIHEKNQNLLGHAASLIWRGGWYYYLEQYDLAYEDIKKGKEIAEEINNKFYVAFALSHFGALYIKQEQLEKALETLQDAWELNHIRWWIGWFIGQTYWLLDQPEQAEQYLILSLDGDRQVNGFRDITCWMFFDVININLDMGRKEKAEEYLRTFEDLIEKYKTNHMVSRRMEAIFSIAKAKIMKENPRMAQKMDAMRLFEQVAQEKDISIEIRCKVYALLNLCDILLLEYKSLNDETILVDIQKNITQIMKIASENQSYSVLVELSLLKSKLALVTKNISETQKLLTEAKKIAQENHLKKLLTQIEQEENEFVDELQKWSNLADQNTPIGEMIQQTKIQTYLDVALAVKEKTLSEKSPR